MKKNQITFVLFLGLMVSQLTSCKKKTPTPAVVETGTVTINLNHKWGTANGSDFKLDTTLVQPDTGDSLNFTTLEYYVSNFKLKKSDGTWWVHPDSYFLVDLSNPGSLSLNLTNVPLGTYTDVNFTMGVDSLHNVSGAQGGALSTTNLMFWSWNSGYIMLKVEGISNNSQTGSFAFHLGGFSGADNIVTDKQISFSGSSLSVSSNHTSKVFLQVNPDWLWHSAPSVSVLNSIHVPGSDAKTMALGFFANNSITFDHIVE